MTGAVGGERVQLRERDLAAVVDEVQLEPLAVAYYDRHDSLPPDDLTRALEIRLSVATDARVRFVAKPIDSRAW
jgi:hypothetical protein